jgi:hypothetical protein
MRTITHITILVSLMVNAVVFGVGAVAILAIPSLDAQAKYLLPVWIAVTFVVSPVIARLGTAPPAARTPRRPAVSRLALTVQTVQSSQSRIRRCAMAPLGGGVVVPGATPDVALRAIIAAVSSRVNQRQSSSSCSSRRMSKEIASP